MSWMSLKKDLKFDSDTEIFYYPSGDCVCCIQNRHFIQLISVYWDYHSKGKTYKCSIGLFLCDICYNYCPSETSGGDEVLALNQLLQNIEKNRSQK
jgi:hypothetical protein